MESNLRLGILTSGNLGFDILQKLYYSNHVIFVMSDKNTLEVINFCKEKNIPFYIGSPRKDVALVFYKDFIIDVLISINYLFLIQQSLIDLPKEIAFNIHGSLLPKYRGRTPHVWAIINNEKETGITAHIIDQGCDTGSILKQIKVIIEDNDTGWTILKKYKKLYHSLILDVLKDIKNNNLKPILQDKGKSTYFNKRTSEDGRINWDWQKERIRNWVRAQSYPYPGAFTQFGAFKLIIDQIEFDESGFELNMPNGLVLNKTPLLIKTPNGVIKVSRVRDYIDFINVGDILN
jgi:methionyl-tRNA formyltransferase